MMIRAELQISEVNPLSMKSCDPDGLITTVHMIVVLRELSIA